MKILESIEEVDIIGCITKELPATAWWSTDPHEYCKGKYNQLELSDLDNLNFDFGVSINYWKLIPGNIIKKPVLGFVNLHHSYNLSYRGRDMNTYAIRDARNLNRWFHGTCLHYTDDGLDTGPIINSRACSINDFDTAWSLFNKVESLGRDILQEWLPRLVVAKAPISFPEDGHPMSNRKDIGKEIKLAQKDKIEIYDFVRSLDFN
ncbi:hypothetical protein NLN82_27990, partial [Citrobacter portucalensis]|uniref:formyltransferase family protein n=1 Tax=Citrobacter portucalensis TaxID=1639133 RepID=UPI00226B69F7